MALIKCTECQKEISDKTESCPHCGCPAADIVGSKAELEIRAKKEREAAEAERKERESAEKAKHDAEASKMAAKVESALHQKNASDAKPLKKQILICWGVICGSAFYFPLSYFPLQAWLLCLWLIGICWYCVCGAKLDSIQKKRGRVIKTLGMALLSFILLALSIPKTVTSGGGSTRVESAPSETKRTDSLCDPDIYYGRACRVACFDDHKCVHEKQRVRGHPCYCHLNQ